MLIASDASADVEIVTCREVLRRRAGFVVHHEQIRLSVRLLGLVILDAAKGYALAVIAKGVIAHAAVEPENFAFVASIQRDRIQIGMRRFIVGFWRAICYEVDSGTVG